MMIGRVLTRSFEFQTRQHKILSLDLGDGIARDFLLLGTLGTAIWFGLLTLLFGLPDNRSIILYLTLPITVLYFGFQPDPKKERRKRITGWILRIRYALVGHRPVLNGLRDAHRGNALSWSRRLNTDLMRAWFANDEVVWERAHDAVPVSFSEGQALEFDYTAKLLGFDVMSQLRSIRKDDDNA